MSPLASSTTYLNASEQCECNLPAASFALLAGSTAIVHCEGVFGEQDDKTANGLVTSPFVAKIEHLAVPTPLSIALTPEIRLS